MVKQGIVIAIIAVSAIGSLFSLEASASPSLEVCQELDSLLHSNMTQPPSEAALQGMGIQKLDTLTDASKAGVFDAYHQCYAEHGKQLAIMSRFTEAQYMDSDIDTVWASLKTIGTTNQGIAALTSEFEAVNQDAQSLFVSINAGALTQEQEAKRNELKSKTQALSKQCFQLNNDPRCYQPISDLEELLGRKMDGKLADISNKIVSERQQAEFAAAQEADRQAAEVRKAKEKKQQEEYQAKQAADQKIAERQGMYLKVAIMVMLTATIIGVGMAFMGKAVFYNDYNDLGGSLATIALPALLFPISMMLPQWFAITMILVVFFGLFAAMVWRTYKANKASPVMTPILVLAKMTLSILYIVHFFAAFNAKEASGRRQGWFVVAIMTPLLVKLVHTRDGSFTYAE